MGGISSPGSSIKPGTVAFFAASTAPAGWLKCNGAAVSRATYAALFNAIGTTYGAGDGATTFNVPDDRGEFIRCWDDGRGVDSGRAFGSAQAHQMQSHTHTALVTTDPAATAVADVGASGAFPRYSSAPTTGVGGTSNSSENRPRNVARLSCIKF